MCVWVCFSIGGAVATHRGERGQRGGGGGTSLDGSAYVLVIGSEACWMGCWIWAARVVGFGRLWEMFGAAVVGRVCVSVCFI